MSFLKEYNSGIKKVILDTDPAIGVFIRDVDDALAIFFALASPELIVEGITVCFGNVNTKRGVEVANQVLQVAERDDVPVLPGATSSKDLGQPTKATDFLIDKVRHNPGEITILCLAPLTNVATAMKQDQRFLGDLGGIIVMGGALERRGNVLPLMSAEFNMWRDPYSAKRVLESKVPSKTLIPLDVTMQTVFTSKHRQLLVDSGNPVAKFCAEKMGSWLNFNRLKARTGFHLHDPMVPAALIQPDLFTTVPKRLRVETENWRKKGAVEDFPILVSEIGLKEAVNVAMGIDAEGFMNLLLERLSSPIDEWPKKLDLGE